MNTVGFLLACTVSFVVTPLVLVLLERHGVLDRPNLPRKLHALPIPVGGGLAIYLAFFLTVFCLAPWQTEPLLQPRLPLLTLCGAASLITALGFWDDVRGLAPGWKLAGQAAAGGILYAGGFSIGLLTNPLGGQIELGLWDAPLTVLWIVALCNAINLIDGLDGLACGVSLIAALALAAIGLHAVQPSRDVPFLFLVLAGAALGFLHYNYHPARVFLGDTGSMLLGLLLGAIALGSARKSSTAIALLLPLVSLGVPVLDTALAILRRRGAGRPLFTGDSEHLHHRLLRLGLAHQDVVKVFYLVSLWLGVVAFSFVLIPNQYALIVLGVVGLGLALAVKSLALLEARQRDGRPVPSAGPAKPTREKTHRLQARPAAWLEAQIRRLLGHRTGQAVERRTTGLGRPESEKLPIDKSL